MSRAYVSKELRQRVAEQSRRRCGYCQVAEAITGMPLEIEHIIPDSSGGTTVEDNLWMACSTCNDFKSDHVCSTDPLTGEVAGFFNPRKQDWFEHFEWSADGAIIVGKTPTGRSTVAGLRMNEPVAVAARRLWVTAGSHPPLP